VVLQALRLLVQVVVLQVVLQAVLQVRHPMVLMALAVGLRVLSQLGLRVLSQN
jgi:hypothetical protein